jgi:hypothetical protein
VSRGLTHAEAAALKSAVQKHKQRLDAGVPQIAGGVTYEGTSAFVARPATVQFVDFTVGAVHRQTVVVTNVSLTFNRCAVSYFYNVIVVFGGNSSSTAEYSNKQYEN